MLRSPDNMLFNFGDRAADRAIMAPMRFAGGVGSGFLRGVGARGLTRRLGGLSTTPRWTSAMSRVNAGVRAATSFRPGTISGPMGWGLGAAVGGAARGGLRLGMGAVRATPALAGFGAGAGYGAATFAGRMAITAAGLSYRALTAGGVGLRGGIYRGMGLAVAGAGLAAGYRGTMNILQGQQFAVGTAPGMSARQTVDSAFAQSAAGLSLSLSELGRK